MKLSIHQQISRRSLVKLLGGAALALPGLELFGGRANAQAVGKQAKYAVFCYTPDGVNQQDFWPTGSTTDFELSKILSPFEAFKDKMLILGPQMSGGNPRGGTGLAYTAPTPQHQAPVTLTARAGKGCNANTDGCYGQPPGLPYAKNQFTAVNDIDGPSIDQVIAESIVGDSLFKSLDFGMHPIGGDTPSDLNFALNGTALKRMETADEAFNRVFGMPVEANASERALNKHNAVSDFLHARFGTLRPSLSAHDKQVLDAHLTSLSSLEAREIRRLQTAGVCMPPGTVPTFSDDDVRSGADTEALTPFFMDTIASAFGCGLSKVASVTFGYPGGGGSGGLRMPWLGFTGPLHDISHHGGGAEKLGQYTQMHTWIASQIAGLMTSLAALKDPEGVPLLDQTVIYWFNRHGDGNAHSNDALPNVILGGTGGYFEMGRHLQLEATNPTKVLISIANSFGVDVPKFGEEIYEDTSPLTGMTA